LNVGTGVPPLTNGEDVTEYFLAENRQPIGFDAALVRSSIEAGDGAQASYLPRR
jgi:hypothetical protein